MPPADLRRYGRRRVLTEGPNSDSVARDHDSSGSMIDDLYSARLLKLAANMPRAGRLAAPDASVEKIAKLCGSRCAGRIVVVEGDRSR